MGSVATRGSAINAVCLDGLLAHVVLRAASGEFGAWNLTLQEFMIVGVQTCRLSALHDDGRRR